LVSCAGYAALRWTCPIGEGIQILDYTVVVQLNSVGFSSATPPPPPHTLIQ
jgi:hypothetical protein